MGENAYLLRVLRIAVDQTNQRSARGKAILAWCRDHDSELRVSVEIANKREKKPKPLGRKLTWENIKSACARIPDTAPGTEPPAIATGRIVAKLLRLNEENRRLLETIITLERTYPAASLAILLNGYELSRMKLVTIMSGLPNESAILRSDLVELGLVQVVTDDSGRSNYWLRWVLDDALSVPPNQKDAIVERFVGKCMTTELGLCDFADRDHSVNFMARILRGACKTQSQGVNILLYGPPGTGKTELAKTLAKAAAAEIFSVGEADEYGEEPSRWERLFCYRLAQRVLSRQSNKVLLFDEMEDLIGNVSRASDGDYFESRVGSKVYLNRLFETNQVPVIWTSNTIGNLDPAFIRRMSFVLKLEIPPSKQSAKMIRRMARSEGFALSKPVSRALAKWSPRSATVARNAFRSTVLADGGVDDVKRTIDALTLGDVRDKKGHQTSPTGTELDFSLYHGKPDVEEFVKSVCRPSLPRDFSVLLVGPPGTGKTQLVHGLATKLGLHLVVKRASDLISKWSGESEKAIAQAFSEAANTGSALFFDEVDSLLYDRASATHSWEVSAVNELLTWMDQHPMPFFAATNFVGKLDRAAMRRFVFKIELQPLPPEKAEAAFQSFFGQKPGSWLRSVDGLTPGDFAVVARQLKYLSTAPEPEAISDMLAREVSARHQATGPIGFRLPKPKEMDTQATSRKH